MSILQFIKDKHRSYALRKKCQTGSRCYKCDHKFTGYDILCGLPIGNPYRDIREEFSTDELGWRCPRCGQYQVSFGYITITMDDIKEFIRLNKGVM